MGKLLGATDYQVLKQFSGREAAQNAGAGEVVCGVWCGAGAYQEEHPGRPQGGKPLSPAVSL